MKYTVRKLCPTCLRGVYASEDIPEGNVIVKVPFKLALKVTDHEKEYAAVRAVITVFWALWASVTVLSLHNPAGQSLRPHC